MCKCVLLQLSDLHFGNENQTSSEMRESLKIDVIKQAVNQRFFYDGLIISGDIIYGKTKNKKRAYKSATAYIKDIQKKLCIPKSHTYIVPGNHDIDIDDQMRNSAIQNTRNKYKSRIGSILDADKEAMKPTDLFKTMYANITGRKYVYGHTLISSHKYIDYLCLDSSRTCTKSTEDYGKIILGINDVDNALDNHNKDKALVVIAHHRYDWLLEQERKKFLGVLSRNNALLFCCGHVHSSEAYLDRNSHTYDKNITVSVAPTLMDDAIEETVMGYNIIHIDTDNESVKIESYEWHDNNSYFSLSWKFPIKGWNQENNDNPLSDYVGLRINSCELFLNRYKRNLSLDNLAYATNIEKKTLERYEKLNKKYTMDNMMIFPECKRSIDILKLSYALHVEWRELVSYPNYWMNKEERVNEYRKKKGVSIENMPMKRDKTKVVVFDFDGTMTKNATLRTSWERMWESCGYSVKQCRDLHKEFSLGQFSHQEWCEKTAEAFKAKGFSRNNIRVIASQIELLHDCKEVIAQLHSLGIQLFIVSGSVDALIKEVLGDNITSMFARIQANQMHFDKEEKLERIIGTKYDFAGKARYVDGIIDKGYKPSEIVFFGNSFNDESVCSTGVRAVCINPKQTQSYEPRYWTDEKTDVVTMKDFLQFIER